MEVSSVNRQTVQPTAATRKVDDVRAAERRTNQAQQNETRQTEQAEARQAANRANEYKKSPPVVNTQGQTTGRLVNTTA
jgi:hypothetical protein